MSRSFTISVFACLLAVTFTLLHSFTRPANAGDFAERHIFGFSPDGNTFAFEQFGIQTYGGKRVPNFVSYLGGHLTDNRQPFGLKYLFLQPFLPGEVAHDAGEDLPIT